jgi:hypothetical protein
MIAGTLAMILKEPVQDSRLVGGLFRPVEKVVGREVHGKRR